jgi:hypothetical protein
MLPSMIHMELNTFAHMQAEARAARAPASAQVGLNGIVQGARFSEATLIHTIVTRRAAEPEEPAPPRTLTYASGDGSALER